VADSGREKDKNNGIPRTSGSGHSKRSRSNPPFQCTETRDERYAGRYGRKNRRSQQEACAATGTRNPKPATGLDADHGTQDRRRSARLVGVGMGVAIASATPKWEQKVPTKK